MIAANGRLSFEDAYAIEQLYARQAHAIDGGDAPTWAATFVPDGIFDSPTYKNSVRGREQLERFARDAIEQVGAGKQRHVVSNLVLAPQSIEAVKTHAYMLITRTDPGASPQLLRSVVVHDVLQRLDGEWLFARRTVERDGSEQPT